MVDIRTKLSPEVNEKLMHWMAEHGISTIDKGLVIARAVEVYVTSIPEDVQLRNLVKEHVEARKAAQMAGLKKAMKKKGKKVK